MIKIIIGFLIAMIITALAVSCYFVSERFQFENKYIFNSYEKIYNYKPKAGDMIYVRCTIGRPLVQYAIDNCFDHFSIVVEKNNKYFMLDINAPNCYYEGSTDYINLIPIEFIQKSHNNYYVAQIEHELSPEDNKKLLNLQYKYPTYLECGFKWLFNTKTDPDRGNQHCLDLMAIVLDTLGIADIKCLSVAGKAKYLIENFGPIKHIIPAN